MFKKAAISTAIFTLIIVNLLLWPYLFGFLSDEEEPKSGPIVQTLTNNQPSEAKASAENAGSDNSDEDERNEDIAPQKKAAPETDSKTELTTTGQVKKQDAFQVIRIQ